MVHLQPGAEELEVFSPMTWYDAGAGALCTARIHDIYSAWDRWQFQCMQTTWNNMERLNDGIRKKHEKQRCVECRGCLWPCALVGKLGWVKFLLG